MKALSVRAPWWLAILNGKPVENRDWKTNFRGRVLIHAGKWWSYRQVRKEWEMVEQMCVADGIGFPTPEETQAHMDHMQRFGGHIVGSVEIVDCVTHHPSAFFVGKYGFVLRNPIELSKPIPFKGALGFFDVPDGFKGIGKREGK